MMLKYGRLGLAESLSGTLGQVVPERPVVLPADDPAVATDAALDVLDAVTDPTGALSGTPPLPRATPRARGSRRRRAAAVATEAGAEREAGA
jgi:hypothetical protein